jgi:hypothetical protein
MSRPSWSRAWMDPGTLTLRTLGSMRSSVALDGCSLLPTAAKAGLRPVRNCVVLLPDSRRTESPPDADGVVRLEGLDPGSCELSFPKLDALVWAQG